MFNMTQNPRASQWRILKCCLHTLTTLTHCIPVQVEVSLHPNTSLHYLQISVCGYLTVDVNSILEANMLFMWKLYYGELQVRSQDLSAKASIRLQTLCLAEVGVYDENAMPIIASKPAICWLQSLGFRQNPASDEDSIDWDVVDSITLELGPTYLLAKQISLHDPAAEQSEHSVEIPGLVIDDQEKAVSKAKSMEGLMCRSLKHQKWLLAGSHGSCLLAWPVPRHIQSTIMTRAFYTIQMLSSHVQNFTVTSDHVYSEGLLAQPAFLNAGSYLLPRQKQHMRCFQWFAIELNYLPYSVPQIAQFNIYCISDAR